MTVGGVMKQYTLPSYFRFKLAAFPTSLFQNGMMRKANKSKTHKSFKEKCIFKFLSSRSIIPCPGWSSLLHKVKWLPNTSYQSILNQYSRYVKSKYGRACIVFDGYDNGPYAKGHDHQRRVGKMAPYVSLEDLQMIPTCSQEIFLKNYRNQVQFISILSEELRILTGKKHPKIKPQR